MIQSNIGCSASSSLRTQSLSESSIRRRADFFGAAGALSEWHPHYEFRPGQVEMAEAVEARCETAGI